MIKRIAWLSILTVVFTSSVFAQVLKKVHWTTELSKKEAKAGEEIEIIFKAVIDQGWYIYSVDFEDCGPIPMTVSFEQKDGFELVGKLRAINDKNKHDEIFGCDVRIFEKTGEFRQKIKILSSKASSIIGSFEGQVCSESEGLCVLFEDDFALDLKISGEPIQALKTEKSDAPKSDVQGAISQPTVDSASVTKNEVQQTLEEDQNYGDNTGPVLDKNILEGEASYGQESFGALLFIAFIAGFASLITPCVFPMVPMTVTFFLRDNQNKKEGLKKGLIFGLSIIAIYTTAGTLFAVLLGTDGLNALATHWAPNLFVFVIFLVFALSFFGLFEINAPHQLVNKADRQAEKGGLLGIFFMAATLVLVSFSCTVPIVGSVLFLSAGGAVLKPIVVMFFYSFAFALPFTLFALFPEWLKSMPKSGGWLNSVKVTLGFLELALSLKFFSIADQAYHWGLLDRDVNIALWVVIFTLLGFYLLGKIRLPNDTPVEKVSISRLILSILIFTFVIYLIPGLWGAPLKALAGYLPPQHTLDFDLVSKGSGSNSNSCEEPKYADFLHLPHGLEGYFDYDQALACARKLNKPLFIDFTGHGCTNCREMEAVVWSDPQVLDRLRNDFVVVALYVDDKTQLPESEWYTSTVDNKVKKTIGKQNADLQIRNLDNNAQPFYVLLGKDERVLAWPYAYDRSVENFVKFLDSGIAKYNQLYRD